MRRSFTLLPVIALFAVAACSGSGSATTSAPTSAPSAAAPSAAPASAPAASSGGGAGTAVTIKNFNFNPATVTVKVGDTVTWTNGDDVAHTVTFDDTSLGGSGSLNNGTSFPTTFSAAGTFTYHCKIHPSMKGTVTVS